MNAGKRKPTHPGVAFNDLVLIPDNKCADIAAKKMGFSHVHDLQDILDGSKKVSQDAAKKFGEYTNTTAASWYNMQIKLDEWAAING